MPDVIAYIAIWIGASLTFGAIYGLAWWRHDREAERQQRRRDLAHAARELASTDERYRAMGGGSW